MTLFDRRGYRSGGVEGDQPESPEMHRRARGGVATKAAPGPPDGATGFYVVENNNGACRQVRADNLDVVEGGLFLVVTVYEHQIEWST
jgi:hypothetical protein